MERREIDSRYKWDLTDIYENGGAWEEALNSLQGMADRMSAYSGKLGEPGALKDCLLLEDELSMRLERVYMYAKMQQDLDNAHPRLSQCRTRRWRQLFRVQEAAAFLLPELTAMEPAKLLRGSRKYAGASCPPAPDRRYYPQPRSCPVRPGGAAPGHGGPGARIDGRGVLDAGEQRSAPGDGG